MTSWRLFPALAVATQPVHDDPIDAGMRICPNIRALLPGSPLCERMLTCIDEHHWRLNPEEMAARLVMEGKRQIDQLHGRIDAARASHPKAQDWPVALISDPDGLRIPTIDGVPPRGVVLPERWQATEIVSGAGIIAPPNTIVATPQGWHHWDNGRWLRRATGSDLPPII